MPAPPLPAASWLAPEAFVSFSALHALVGVVSLAGWMLAVLWARQVRGTPAERPWRRGMALLLWSFNAAWAVRLLFPDEFAWGHSLPLHLCDWAWIAGGWSLWSGGDPQRARHQVPVLWGVALSLLAYLTPAVTAGPGGVRFWTFWISHWQILAVALVNLVAFGTRPDARGLAAALGLAALGCLLATAVNLALDTGYFFTGRTLPEQPTPLDHLGPWPLRILWVALLGGAALGLVAGPFLLRRRRQSTSIASPYE